MKKCATIFGFAALIVTPAMAADLAIKSPPSAPPPPPVFTWTGLYVGVNFGGGFGDKWWDNSSATNNAFWWGFPGQNIGTSGMDGVLGGGQVGYNWQFPASPVVVGVEGTFDWTNTEGHFNTGIVGTFTDTPKSKLDWIGTVVGRVGLAVDHALIYAGGGVAWTREVDTISGFGPGLLGTGLNVAYSGSATEFGATFLTGVEYAFGAWSARLQYNFYDFNNNSITLVSGNTPTTEITGATLGLSTPLRINAVTAGLNYRFY